MNTVERQLVTIIGKALLETRLLADIYRLSATGDSMNHTEGRGTRHVHATDWEGPNVRIETIVTEQVADAIMEHVSATYFTNYAVVVFASTVRVARPQKF